MRSLWLSLDTSTPSMSAALLSCGRGSLEVLATREAGPPQVVSTLIPSVFDVLLTEAGAQLRDVSAVVAGLGPGLFTGVRVAAATMKSIAYARSLPLLGAGTLEAMALAVSRGGAAQPGAQFETSNAGAEDDVVFCPVLDARKGELYFGMYRVRGLEVRQVLAPEASSPARLVECLSALDEPVVAFGSGIAPAGELPLHVRTLTEPRGPGAAEIAALAWYRNSSPVYDAQAVLSLEPTYLRPPEAEVARRRREGR